MRADTIDTGPYIGVWQQFGPPEVVALDPIAGNATAIHEASGFWEIVDSIALLLSTAAGGATRTPIVSYLSGDAVPFAQVQPGAGQAASHVVRYTLAREVTDAGVLNGPAILTQLPPLALLPGWALELAVTAGAAGDTVTDIRICRRRFRVLELG